MGCILLWSQIWSLDLRPRALCIVLHPDLLRWSWLLAPGVVSPTPAPETIKVFPPCPSWPLINLSAVWLRATKSSLWRAPQLQLKQLTQPEGCAWHTTTGCHTHATLCIVLCYETDDGWDTVLSFINGMHIFQLDAQSFACNPAMQHILIQCLHTLLASKQEFPWFSQLTIAFPPISPLWPASSFVSQAMKHCWPLF